MRDHSNSAGERPSAGEREIVKRYTGQVAWPTVALCGLLVAAFGTVVALAVMRTIPMWLGTLLNSIVVYCFYTVHHDATHKAISGRRGRWLWLDTTCGTVAAVALQLDFRGYAASHLRHHAFTNRPDDPDIVVRGPLWQLPLKWLGGVVLTPVISLPFCAPIGAAIERSLAPDLPPPDQRRRADGARVRRWQQGCLVALLLTIPLGWFWSAVLLWWLPTQLGILYLIVLFQWLPHVPFDRTDRYGATRITRFRGSSVLLLFQDHHLVHHLYPSVPWYRYGSLFRELRPYLEANNARIQGRDTHPHVPINLRFTPSVAQLTPEPPAKARTTQQPSATTDRSEEGR